MVHGIHPEKLFYYSVGVFNGDGQNFRNADKKFDAMGRGWIAPLALSSLDVVKAIEVGGSFWLGDRANALALAPQTTQGGFTFFKPSWSAMNMAMPPVSVPYELHQNGTMTAWALELDAPIAHKGGLRWEYVHKNQELAVNDVSKPTAQVTKGGSKLDGYSTYGEIYYWLVGDDRIIGPQALQLPTRIKKFGTQAPRPGLVLQLRFEHLSETVTDTDETAMMMLGNGVAGKTEVNSFEFGATYWHSKRFRATFNYVFNHFSGDAPFVTGLTSQDEHEFLFRLGVAL
jgi:hypothetical protein